jgi:hypothetical protein
MAAHNQTTLLPLWYVPLQLYTTKLVSNHNNNEHQLCLLPNPWLSTSPQSNIAILIITIKIIAIDRTRPRTVVETAWMKDEFNCSLSISQQQQQLRMPMNDKSIGLTANRSFRGVIDVLELPCHTCALKPQRDWAQIFLKNTKYVHFINSSAKTKTKSQCAYGFVGFE